MLASDLRVSIEESRAELHRALQSEAFRGARALRHLLEFLAEKSLSGDAENLKEYSIGIDAFGKPSDYDPREDSTVRIQAGRLRQKLADYYRQEGKDHPVTMELPKGGFRLEFVPRAEVPKWTEPPVAIVPLVEKPIEQPSHSRTWRTATLVLAVALAGTAAWSAVELRRERLLMAGVWNAQMEQLWAPLLDPARPLVIAVSTPLFVGVEGSGYYRTVRTNRWEEAIQDPGLKGIMKGLNNPEISPRHPYTGVADANAVFLLEKILALRKPNTQFARNIDLTWRQLTDSNVLLIGAAQYSRELLSSLPARLQLNLDPDGLRIAKPQDGETAFFPDQVRKSQSASGTDDGEVYSLITHVAGPNGNGDVVAFASNLYAGSLAAVEWFTTPELARVLADKMQSSSGTIPRYYQIGLKVKFRGGVPTDTSYLMHRNLQ